MRTAGNCHRAALSIYRRHEIDSGIFSRNKNKNIASLKEWLPTCSENFRNIEHLAKRKNILPFQKTQDRQNSCHDKLGFFRIGN